MQINVNIIDLISNLVDPQDATVIEVAGARAVALMAHGDQKYGASSPYIVHLDAVARLVEPWGPTHMTIAYLHDVLEDTTFPRGQLRMLFGDLVTDCVDLITDPKDVARPYAKMVVNDRLVRAPGRLDPALVVKVADRLANVRAAMAEGRVDLWQRYHDEHRAFWSAAYRKGMCDRLWAELNARLHID